MRLFAFFFSMLLALTGQSATSSKVIYGYVEKATIIDNNLTLSAKLDTGAKSSSLHAIDIKKVRIDGKSYIRFTVPHQGGATKFLSEYLGKVSIKPRAQEIEHIKRPVVWMKMRLGDQERTIRVNLTNRANFMYPLLLGRQAIVAFNGIVDPSVRYGIISRPTPTPTTEPK